MNLADDRHTTESLEYCKTIESLNERIDKLEQQTTQATTTVIIEDEPLGTVWNGIVSPLEPVLATSTSNVMEYVGTFKVSAYCACSKCTGNTKGITASGAKVQEGVTVAADWSVLPVGTVIDIEGYGTRTVMDKGSAIKGNRLDIYFQKHADAINFGVQYLDVYIVK
jgi:3D (Asp-Asp-Asp) domain-containing protein